VVVTGEQLAFDIPTPPSEDDIETRLRAAVTEDGMTDAEIDAAVQDARQRLGVGPVEARPAQSCVCVGVPLVFVDAFAEDRRCARCGRDPRS
jgi:hypothetical protein